MKNNQNELKVVSIRLVEEPPLYSRKKISNPAEVLEVVGEELRKYDRELFCILNLRTKTQVINMNIVSMGTLNSTLVSPREVFKSAILSNAAGIMLVHNHPSGSPEPSRQDILVTKKLEESGILLGIPVIDHIIVGDKEKLYSFRENKQLMGEVQEFAVAQKTTPCKSCSR